MSRADETRLEFSLQAEALSKAPLRYEADRLWVPDGPGLGISL